MNSLAGDTLLLLGMHIQDTRRNPVWLIVGLLQPVIWLLLFAPLLEGLMGMPGFEAGKSIDFFTPGLLMMLAVVSTIFAGMGIINDIREGILEKLRVTPVHRLALPLSLIVRDWLMLMVQALVLLLLAFVMGMRPDPLGLALMLLLVSLVGLSLASLSYVLALLSRNEYALSAIANFLVLPVVLLSGITLPLTLAPPFLRMLGAFNPLTYAVDAARALGNGAFSDSSIAPAKGIFTLLLVTTFLWAVRSFRLATR